MASFLFGGDISAQSAISGGDSESLTLLDGVQKFWLFTGFYNVAWGNIIMIAVGLFFIFLSIRYKFEPLLLIPIGTGIILGNIPFPQQEVGAALGLWDASSSGLEVGIY